MFILQQILPGGLAAALVAGLGLVLGARFWPACKRWLPAVLLAAAYATGHGLTAGWPRFPPNEAAPWLFYFAVIALVVGGLDASFAAKAVIRGFAGGLVFSGLLRLLLASQFQSAWTPLQGWLRLGAMAAAAVLFAWTLEKTARQNLRFFSLPLAAGIVATGSGIALMLSGSLVLGLLAFVLSAAAGAMTVAGWMIPSLRFERGVPAVLAILLMGLWASGYFYAELPVASVLLLATAPAAALLIPTAGRQESWKNFAARTAATSLLTAGAVFIALRASPPLDY